MLYLSSKVNTFTSTVGLSTSDYQNTRKSEHDGDHICLQSSFNHFQSRRLTSGAIAGLFLSIIFALVALICVFCGKRNATIGLSVVARACIAVAVFFVASYFYS
jgi:hypothetical protein